MRLTRGPGTNMGKPQTLEELLALATASRVAQNRCDIEETQEGLDARTDPIITAKDLYRLAGDLDKDPEAMVYLLITITLLGIARERGKVVPDSIYEWPITHLPERVLESIDDIPVQAWTRDLEQVLCHQVANTIREAIQRGLDVDEFMVLPDVLGAQRCLIAMGQAPDMRPTASDIEAMLGLIRRHEDLIKTTRVISGREMPPVDMGIGWPGIKTGEA